MANTVYVNVGGLWKTVSNYYVNVNGVWKEGTAFASNIGGTWKGATAAPSGPVTFPTALEIATIDFAEFMSVPAVYIGGKQGIDVSTLDYAEWMSKPVWGRNSVFVYTAPPATSSILPTEADLRTLDYAEWMAMPNVRLSTSGLVRMDGLDAAEFMSVPYWGITPTAPASSPPPPPDYPTALSILTLDFAEFMSLPSARVAAKSTVDAKGLDYAEWMAQPSYSRDSTFVYTAPPSSPSILPTATNAKTLDYAEWMSMPNIRLDSKSNVDGASLDYAEFMSLPHYTF